MRKRKYYSPQQKVAILRRHFLDDVPVSDLCDEYGLQPGVFYRWQRQLFENGTAAFATKRKDSAQQKLERKVASLQAKIEQKNEVVAELMQEHVALKKVLGRFERWLGGA